MHDSKKHSISLDPFLHAYQLIKVKEVTVLIPSLFLVANVVLVVVIMRSCKNWLKACTSSSCISLFALHGLHPQCKKINWLLIFWNRIETEIDIYELVALLLMI